MRISRTQLEAYLDGELQGEELGLVEVFVRGAEEAKLLGELKLEREKRAAVWKSYEPTEGETKAAYENLMQVLVEQGDAPIGGWWRKTRMYWGVAAGLVIVAGSFFAGRVTAKSSSDNEIAKINNHSQPAVWVVDMQSMDGVVSKYEFKSLEDATAFVKEQQKKAVAMASTEGGFF